MSAPVDHLPKPEGWRFDRKTAWDFFRCARCGSSAHPTLNPYSNIATWSDADRDEYWISALCPKCWDAVMEGVER